MKKDGKLPYGQIGRIEFEQDYIHDITDENETKIKYTNVEKIAINNNYIYIYFNAIQAFLIPFHVFENNEQKEMFFSFINNKIETSGQPHQLK